MGMKRDMQDQIERYRAFCSSETSVPIFCRDWWLDAVAAQKWGAVLIESEGRVAAAMPYVVGRRFAQPVILQPPLTQFLGPWLAPCAGREQKRLETEKELLQQLFAQLPYTAGFRQTWHRDRTNWLPPALARLLTNDTLHLPTGRSHGSRGRVVRVQLEYPQGDSQGRRSLWTPLAQVANY
jgi:hypothetical protein